MFWIILFLLGVMVAVVYAVVWLALMVFLGLASLVLVFVHALALGVRDQRRKKLDRDNPWRKGGPRSAAVSFRRERKSTHRGRVLY
jgi:hypothetical protein